MPETTPRIEQQPASEGGRVRVLGKWTASQLAMARRLRALNTELAGTGVQQGWDLTGAEQLDHMGAQVLWDHWGRGWPEHIDLLPARVPFIVPD